MKTSEIKEKRWYTDGKGNLRYVHYDWVTYPPGEKRRRCAYTDIRNGDLRQCSIARVESVARWAKREVPPPKA